MSACPGHYRHWFTAPDSIGIRTPVCQRCGEPNPKWTAEDQRVWDSHNAPYVPMCMFRNEDRSSFCFWPAGHAGGHHMSKPKKARGPAS